MIEPTKNRHATACAVKTDSMDTHRKISAKGGAAGKGDAKRRSPEHYAEMNRKRWEKYRAKKAEQTEANTNAPTCATCQRWTSTSVDRLRGYCDAYQIPATSTDHCHKYQPKETS